MTVHITYWETYQYTKGKRPTNKVLQNVTELHRFYGHYSDNDYLKISYNENDELYVLWDEITQLTVTK